MSDFRMTANWVVSDDMDAILRSTTASLSIDVDGICLTQNVNGWTGSVQDTIIVSTYPLARWFAYYWWRLEEELLVVDDRRPDYDWRVAHELGAANHGYVWPKILFASDGEYINIWSDVIPTPLQSVNYIGKLDAVKSVAIDAFQRQAEALIEATIQRVSEMDADLPELWKIVCGERSDTVASNARRLEALFGYDPEECPKALLDQALQFQESAGSTSIKEIVPFISMSKGLPQHLQSAKGIEFRPQVRQSQLKAGVSGAFPWQKGIGAAQQLRRLCDVGDGPVDNDRLLGLLGMASDGISRYSWYSTEIPVSVGRNRPDGSWSFAPRARNFETGRRFELARLLGDLLLYGDEAKEWLVTSDCKSSRQKSQRAFAGEFLCPIASLTDYLNGDYSEERCEMAAKTFNVSPLTINTILLNNGAIERDNAVFPYSVHG